MAVTMLCACCCCYNNQTMLLDKAEAVYVWNCFVLNCSPQNGNARTPAERERERMMCVRQRWMEIVREEKHEKRVREIASERSAYIPVMVYGIHIHTREVHGKWSALHRRTKEIEESRSSIDDLVWDWYVVVLMLLLLQLLLLESYTNYSCNPLIPTSSIQIRKKTHTITSPLWNDILSLTIHVVNVFGSVVQHCVEWNGSFIAMLRKRVHRDKTREIYTYSVLRVPSIDGSNNNDEKVPSLRTCISDVLSLLHCTLFTVHCVLYTHLMCVNVFPSW